jgi:hypothetical protein
VRRYRNPAVLTLAVALVVSLAIHLPIWGALGFLAKLWKDDVAAADANDVAVELDFGDPTTVEDEPEDEIVAPAETESQEDAVDEAAQLASAAAEERAPRQEPEEEEPLREAAPEEEVAEVEVERVVQPPRADLQAVQQRSRNPEVEAPDNARFIARENSVVEEETVAELRNYQRDDVEQSPGEASEADAEDPGNDAEEEIADARDMEGSDQRTATEEEARADRPREAAERPLPNEVARGDTAREGAAQMSNGDSTSSEGGERGGATARGGGETRERVVEIDDGAGTFRITVREPRPEGEGAGDGGGQLRSGSGTGETGRGERARAPGAGRSGDRGRGRGTGREGADLRVSWSMFEEVYTEEELREEREAWVEERQSRLRGSNRQEEWNRFRAAIENFVPNVRPGNQTALNAAASPFADYLAHVHRRIHRQFADNFLRGLPAGGTSPFADRSLNTKLEIILNRDGTVHRIGVVKTSGFLAFDHGAYASVMRGQPYPEAPSQILSGDGRVYFHWGFYRNERQCGTFNAEPYILPNPPGTPAGGGGPLRDRMEQGGVVPRGAEPTWGTQREREHEREREPPPENPPPQNDDGAPPPEPPEPDDAALG